MSSTLEKITNPIIETTDILDELTLDDAKDLTHKLRNSLQHSSQLYITAWKHQVWKTLGYTSWEKYINGEFGDLRVALPKEQRTHTVIEMAEAGMPTRAISTTTGISKSSVNREIKQAQKENKLPEHLSTTGTDGRIRRQPTKQPLQLDDELLDQSVDQVGIGYFKSKPATKTTPASRSQPVQEEPRKTENTYGLAEVEKIATEYEEAIKASILANDRQKFNTADIPLHLVTATSRSLLATAGLINLFNLQPDLTKDNDEIIKTLESTVQTLDNAIDSLRGADA